MANAEWYVYKADQCARLAAETTDLRLRAKYADEERLWRKLAEDIAEKNRTEGRPL